MKKLRSAFAILLLSAATFAEGLPAWQVDGILPQLTAKEFLSASRWLWRADSAQNGETCTFRCVFDVPGEIASSSWNLSADDFGWYWVNGRSLSRDGIRSAVRQGRNELVVAVSNAFSAAGLLIYGDVTLKDGRHVVINSNAQSFDVSDGFPADVTQTFDGTGYAWRPATEFGDVWAEPFSRYRDYSLSFATEEERAAKAARVAARAAWHEGLRNEPAPDVRIVYTNGLPKISLNGELIEPEFNQSEIDNLYRLNGAVKMDSLGIPIHQLAFSTGEYEKESGVYDFTVFDTKVRTLLDAVPNARVLMLVRMEFPKWLAEHPEARIGYSDGSVTSGGDDLSDRVARPSPASSAYHDEVRRFLTQLGAYVASQPWANRVVALRPCWGIYTEWHMYGMYHGPDVGPAMMDAFHRWKDGKYAGQAAPTMSERLSDDVFFLNDGHEKTIDFFECQATEIANLMLEVAKTTKTAFPGRLVGTYYGYVLTQQTPEGANVMLDKVLASPHIDFISNPADYTATSRLAGGAYYHRTVPSTCHRYGKLVMLEDDMRHYHIYDAIKSLTGLCTRNEREAEMTTRRNWLNRYFDGCGLQMLDPEYKCDHTFSMDAPPILRAIHDTKRILDRLPARADDSGNNTAVVVDWRTRLRCSSKTTYAGDLVYRHSMEGIYASGVPVDIMTLDDFLAQPADRYRKAVFLNVVAPEGEMREALRVRVSASDFRSVWLIRCPFDLPDSSRTLFKMDALPLGQEQWRTILTSLGAEPVAPAGHYVRRHGNVIMFHTGAAGRYEVSFPPAVTKVRELYSDRVYDAQNLMLETDGPDTLVLEAITSESWEVGEDVVATLDSDGVLSFSGSGMTRDFAGADDVPWRPADVSSVRIGEGVSLGRNVLAGIAGSADVCLPIASFLGLADASAPEGMVLVSKAELGAAGAETLRIDGGRALLGVSICTNADLSVARSEWRPVKFEKGDLSVSEDGSRILAPVPANAPRGFMILRSADARE